MEINFFVLDSNEKLISSDLTLLHYKLFIANARGRMEVRAPRRSW